MSTAIVILNWNGGQMLLKYLPSVISHSYGATIFVADNASTDDSLLILEKEFPSVKVIILDKNFGFAEGYNNALKEISSEYYLLLNSDVEVTSGWLRPLQIFMETHPDVAACQPKVRSVLNPDMFEYSGACGGYIDRYGYPYCRGRIFSTIEHDDGQYDEPAEIHWASGAALMIRSSDYWNAGGFDSRFFAHNEEIDLCWRLRLMGRKIYCIPNSVVYHLGGGTLPKGNSMKIFLNFRNNLTMLFKCLPDRDLKHVLNVRKILDYLAAFQSIFRSRGFKDFNAIVSARKAFKKWIYSFEKDRELIQSSASDAPVSSYSILWRYYVLRRKVFKRL